jgi:drug/metabolite transporter (DMT)-like permease
MMFTSGGSGAVYVRHPLERLFRDAQVIRQHGFVAASRYETVAQVRLGPVKLPLATKWTAASGVCTALILVTVPLSYTFQDVSIPFMQLLMRGDILIIAPVVDLLMRRRVHWWSWAALGLVGVALVVTLSARGGLKLPPLAIATIVVYTIGYFGRLWIMSRVSKDDDPVRLRAFFSEEKIVAFPVAILMLLAVVAFGGRQGAELSWGFVTVWTRPEMLLISLCGLMVCLTGVFSAFILLNARENSYCVPLERSASILAGIFGSVLLAVFLGGRMPSGAEFAGAGLLIVAVTLLWLGPRLAADRASRRTGAKEAKSDAVAESPS